MVISLNAGWIGGAGIRSLSSWYTVHGYRRYLEEDGKMDKIILHDSDIREPLFDYLEESFGKVRILEEKQMSCLRGI